MAKVHIPNIPDIPPVKDPAVYEFLKAVKEAIEVLTGKVGGNTSLIDYMKTHG